MSTLPPVDPTLIMQEVNQSDLVRRKLDMNSLKQRLGDNTTKEQKLRESCEGFEAIFLQKMWEQMRKTVPKEGYLHSKDEEMYQSMFDVELCKKMASAGGMGLADMLYAQLSQQLEDTGRTTTPGSYRMPLEIAPSTGLLPGQPEMEAKTPVAESKLTAESLYTPLVQQDSEPAPEADTAPKEPAPSTISSALYAIKSELGMVPAGEPGAAVQEWAEYRDTITGARAVPSVNTSPVPENRLPGQGTPAQATEQPTGLPVQAQELSSPQNPVNVEAKPLEAVSPPLKNNNLFGRDKKTAQDKLAETKAKPPVVPRGMAPQDTLWPISGEAGTVISRFGWEDDASSGKRHWNSGIRIAVEPGTPVRAVLPGTVVYAGERDGYGHTVVLEHKDGFRSYYSNLAPNQIKLGDKISHGAEFAQTTTLNTQPQQEENSASLHFELKKGEMALNPESAIARMTYASN